MRLVHLFTGPDGQSHVRHEDIDVTAAGDDVASSWQRATSIRFEETPGGAARAWHVAPRRQYVITLSGHLEFTTRDGDHFELHPGDVLLAEDTTGGGHRWRILGPDPWRRAYVSLEDAP